MRIEFINIYLWIFITELTRFYSFSDPCEGAPTCGSCASCRVINHGVQCSCPAGLIGNPLISCIKPSVRCDGNCECNAASGFCVNRCSNNKDCSCGEICHSGFCSMKCSSNSACQPVSFF